MSDGGEGDTVVTGSAISCDRLDFCGVAVDFADDRRVLVRAGVGDGPGGGATGLNRIGLSPRAGLFGMVGYSISPGGVATGLGSDCS